MWRHFSAAACLISLAAAFSGPVPFRSRRVVVPVVSAPFRATTATFSASSATAVAGAATSLVDLAETFVNSQSGFFSPYSADMFSDDFVFRGPIVGPLNKADYFATMDMFMVYKAFPDISPNAFGFSVDPMDEKRVWFFVRQTGTNTGPWGLGYGIEAPPSGNAVVGVPEAFSITFDDVSSSVEKLATRS